MVLVQVDLSVGENKILELFKVVNDCVDKREALRLMIRRCDDSCVLKGDVNVR